MRDFQWRTATDFDENWITRSYDLSKLETVDLFMSYWGGPTMAHLMVSFGFSNGQYLNWSIEVKRSVGETFSPVADFFKANTVSLIASREKDAVGLRSNIQEANVRLFRLNAEPGFARGLLEKYVTAANSLAEEPIFFNSVFTNCSMGAVRLAVAAARMISRYACLSDNTASRVGTEYSRVRPVISALGNVFARHHDQTVQLASSNCQSCANGYIGPVRTGEDQFQ